MVILIFKHLISKLRLIEGDQQEHEFFESHYSSHENGPKSQLGLVADPVIKAIARLEFEDALRTGVLPGGCWYPYGGRT